MHGWYFLLWDNLGCFIEQKSPLLSNAVLHLYIVHMKEKLIGGSPKANIADVQNPLFS